MIKSKGFIIAKFMPPHRGHLGLFDNALEEVKSLTMVILGIYQQHHKTISSNFTKKDASWSKINSFDIA